MNNRFMQEVIYQWVMRCFGASVANSREERALRVVEEAVELAQSIGAQEAKIAAIVREVYDRPAGEPYQELGGVMVTAYAFAEASRISAEGALMQETKRMLAKSPSHFRKRMQEKIDKGLASTVITGVPSDE